MHRLNDVHVLVVEDSLQMRNLLRTFLRAAGFEHITDAANAEMAMRILRSEPIDLVIVDWKMQPVDGIALTRMIRGCDSPHIACKPILMLTAHSELSRVSAARDAGVSGFLRKPVSAALLFERLSKALLDERVFVRTADFFGPDRRKRQNPAYNGPWRRADDKTAQPGRAYRSSADEDALDIDDFDR